MSGELEKTIQHGIAATRWLLAPMYLGLALLLIVLLVQFVRDFFNILPEVFRMGALEAMSPILTLGLVLIAAHAVLLVLQTGYQLFRPGLVAEQEPEDGRGRLDFDALRNRLLGVSVVFVLILVIRQLINQSTAGAAGDLSAIWPLAAVLGLLMITALVLAVADWFTALTRREPPE